MKVGFTGSRQRPTAAQCEWLAEELRLLGATELHHGDCEGADEVAHYAARELKLRVVVHPPLDPCLRAFCVGDEERPALPYLDRNKNIVNETDYLLALPSGPEELRSGTWSTIRYARRGYKPISLEMP